MREKKMFQRGNNMLYRRFLGSIINTNFAFCPILSVSNIVFLTMKKTAEAMGEKVKGKNNEANLRVELGNSPWEEM